jgi:V/A-type H+-transporting ATPase subunit A
MGNLIRNSILIQSAFDDIDCFTDVNKLLYQIKLVLLLFNKGKELLKSGFIMEDIEKLNVINDIMRISKSIPNDKYKDILNIKDKMLKEIESLKTMFGESRERFI